MSKKFNWMPILRTGTFTDKNEQTVSVDEAVLDKIVAATDLSKEPQLVIEHPSFDEIGFGTIQKLKRIGSRLFALPKAVEEKLKSAVNSGKLPGRSVTLDKNNFSLKNISFLPPNIPPAVSELGVYSFSEGQDGILSYELSFPGIESHFAEIDSGDIEFAQYEVSGHPFRLIKDAMNGIREFIIDKFDLDTANKILPNWMLNDIGNPPRVYEKPEKSSGSSLSSSLNSNTNFSSDINGDNKMDLSNIDLSKVDPNIRTAFEALNKENTTLTTKLADRDIELQAATTKLTEAEKATLRNEVLQFFDGDDVKLKIKPAIKEKAVNFLMAQKEVSKNGVIEFSSAGDNGIAVKVEFSAYEFAQEIIKMLPDVIELSELATKKAAGEQTGLTDYQKTAKAIADSVNR